MTVFPDEAALDYDERIERLVPGYRLALELMGCMLAGSGPAPQRILVPGCGTGAEIAVLAGFFPAARFTAVEPSRGMLEKARERLAGSGVSARTAFVHGLLDDAPEEKHDAATASLVLHFLPDDGAKAAFLAGIARRLLPGAPLLLFDPPASGEDEPLRRWLLRQGHEPLAANAVIGRMQKDWRRIDTPRRDALLAQSGFDPPVTFFRVPGFTALIAKKAGGK